MMSISEITSLKEDKSKSVQEKLFFTARRTPPPLVRAVDSLERSLRKTLKFGGNNSLLEISLDSQDSEVAIKSYSHSKTEL